MKLTTIANPKELPGECYLRMWTTREEVEKYHPDAAEVFVYSPTGAGSYYYVPVLE